MLRQLLSLVDRLLGLVERATAPDPDAPKYHEWIEVSLKRGGRFVRDRRCKHCGAFRRDPQQDVQLCRSRLHLH